MKAKQMYGDLLQMENFAKGILFMAGRILEIRKEFFKMREKLANVLWGLMLIAIGVLVGGKALGFWEFSALFPGWWTLFFIVPSLLAMVKSGPRPVNTLFLLFGVLLLLERNGVIESNMLGKAIVPMIFLVIGVFILLGSLASGVKRRYKGDKGYSATFAGNVVLPEEMEPFQGCEADAVFGGLNLDLRNVTIEDGAVIEATAIFGGIDIKVPAGISVKVRRTELFGGARSRISNRNGQPVLYVNALCMFGGVDIK